MTAATPPPPRDGEVCTCGHERDDHAHNVDAQTAWTAPCYRDECDCDDYCTCPDLGAVNWKTPHDRSCPAVASAAPSPVDTEPPAEAQQESVQPRAHRDAAGVLWVPVEVDPVWAALAARPSADTETLLPVRAEIIRQVREAAWRDGYEACRRGDQPHNPYRAALDAR